MAWRVALLVGVTVAVLLYGVSVWAYGQERTIQTTPCVYGYGGWGRCAPAPGTTLNYSWNEGPRRTETVTVNPHGDLARFSRYAAGATIIVTLAALPLLGLMRRRGEAPPDTATRVD